MVQIKHKTTGNVIIEFDDYLLTVFRSPVLVLEDLSGADLRGFDFKTLDLQYTNFTEADLTGADLSDTHCLDTIFTNAILTNADLPNSLYDCIGNGKEIVNLDTNRYKVCLTKDRLNIGCQDHAYQDWYEFDTDEIGELSDYALEFWQQYKDEIFQKAQELGFWTPPVTEQGQTEA